MNLLSITISAAKYSFDVYEVVCQPTFQSHFNRGASHPSPLIYAAEHNNFPSFFS